MNFQCVWIINVLQADGTTVPVRGTGGLILGFYAKANAEARAKALYPGIKDADYIIQFV